MRSLPVPMQRPACCRAGFFVQAILVTAGSLGLSPGAVAQVLESSDYLMRMDLDGNGRVSLGEYQDWLSYAFDAMDRDRDGALSLAELPGRRGKPISRDQHRATLAAAFERQDANRDGALSARELAAPPR